MIRKYASASSTVSGVVWRRCKIGEVNQIPTAARIAKNTPSVTENVDSTWGTESVRPPPNLCPTKIESPRVNPVIAIR